jgi:SAM-dependent methyltransferase
MIFNTRLYEKGYASDLIRGIDEPRPWNLNNEILMLSSSNHSLLDIGSGDARKVIPIAKKVKHVFAMEPSVEMRSLADQMVAESNLSNITITNGVADNLPFPDNSFEIVTCSLAPWDTKEVFRVLKPGGKFINETLGCADKLEFKKYFGKDENNSWRGQLINFSEPNFSFNIQNEFQEFNDFKNCNGFWNTYYTEEGLLELCKYTPTIKDFDIEKDMVFLKKAIDSLKTNKGIKITQNRLLIIATKP